MDEPGHTGNKNLDIYAQLPQQLTLSVMDIENEAGVGDGAVLTIRPGTPAFAHMLSISGHEIGLGSIKVIHSHVIVSA